MIASTESDVRDWLIAAGTLGAVFAALFLQLGWPYLRRPKLVIRRGTRPDSLDDGEPVSWWYDLPVANVGRGTTAREVEVVVTDVFSIDKDGWLYKTKVPHRALKWTHGEDSRSDLPAGFNRSVTIGAQRPATEAKPLRFEVGTHPPLGNSERHVLPPGRYRFDLSLVAANAKASSYSFTIVFLANGKVRLPGGVQPAGEPPQPVVVRYLPPTALEHLPLPSLPRFGKMRESVGLSRGRKT
jgi:hypothetical protein